MFVASTRFMVMLHICMFFEGHCTKKGKQSFTKQAVQVRHHAHFPLPCCIMDIVHIKEGKKLSNSIQVKRDAATLLRQWQQKAGGLWILLLLFMAGLLNGTVYLVFARTPSHMSGNFTRLGISLFRDIGTPSGLFALLVISYFIGAVLTGLVFPEHRLSPWRRIGLVLLTCGTLLVLSELVFADTAPRVAAIALVLGGQNGLSVRYKGILTRTTHITGHLTDCGSALGRMIHQKAFHGQNRMLFFFHLSCLGTFFFGVVFSTQIPPFIEGITKLGALTQAGLLYLLLGLGTLVRGVLPLGKKLQRRG